MKYKINFKFGFFRTRTITEQENVDKFNLIQKIGSNGFFYKKENRWISPYCINYIQF